MSLYLSMLTRLYLLCQFEAIVPLFSFNAVTSTPVEIVSSSINLLFLISNGIIKMFLKTMEYKKHKKFV